jgi:hypothetical protein
MNSKQLVSILLAITTTQHLYAQKTIGWMPDTAYSFGRGINSALPVLDSVPETCIDISSIQIQPNDVDPGDTVQTVFWTDYVTDSRKIDQLFGVSGSAAGQLEFKNRQSKDAPAVSAYGSYFEKRSLDDTSVALVIHADANYGSYSVIPRVSSQGYTLNDRHQKLIDAAKNAYAANDLVTARKYLNLFFKKCGTHFISGQTRRGLISAVIKISNLTKEKKRELLAAASAGETVSTRPEPPKTDEVVPRDTFKFPLPPANAQASGKGVSLGLDKFLKSAKESSGTIKISLITAGGGGLAAMNKIFDGVTETLTLGNLAAAMQQYMASFIKTQVAPTNNPGEVITQIAPDTVQFTKELPEFMTLAQASKILPGAPKNYALSSYEVIANSVEDMEFYNSDFYKSVELSWSPSADAIVEEAYYRYVKAFANREALNKIVTEASDISTVDPEVVKAINKYDVYLKKLWGIIRELIPLESTLGSKTIYKTSIDCIDQLPALPNIMPQLYTTQMNISTAKFYCTTKQVSCGTPDNVWVKSGIPIWKSYFTIEGIIGSRAKISKILIQYVDSVDAQANNRRINVLTYYPEMNSASSYINDKGEFSFSFGETSNAQNFSNYKMFREGKTHFEVLVYEKSGELKVYSVSDFELVGQHIPKAKLYRK